MRARRRLSGATTITINVPFALTREQIAGLLTCHTAYRPGITSRYGQHLIGQVIRRDPDIINRLPVVADTTSGRFEKALADVDRWILFPYTAEAAEQPTPEDGS
jgi:hypothetical protein